MQKLTTTEKHSYIKDTLVPWFSPLIEQPTTRVTKNL